MFKIKRFDVLQTSLMAAVIYFFLFLVFVPFLLIPALLAGNPINPAFGLSFGFFIGLLPFAYALVGFVMTAILTSIYNVSSKFIGGIQVEVERIETEEDDDEEE